MVITPDNLAGKSGKLKIKIKIEKNESCTSDFYDGYALQAGNTQALANLSAQVEQLKNILAQIVAAYSQIVTGGTQLADGSKEQLTGSKSLTDGTLRLCDGITELKSGVTELNDGTQETKAETEKLSFWQKLINLFR